MTITRIETCITALEQGVCLFETDCIAHVEWSVEDGDLDWKIEAFEVRNFVTSWNDAKGCFEATPERSVFIRPGHDLFSTFLKHADADAIAGRLVDQEGIVLGNAAADHRAAYHSAVL